MVDEQPITTNPYAVPREETTPDWWLEDPEPMVKTPLSWLEVAVVLAVIGVLAGLLTPAVIYSHPSRSRSLDEIEAMKSSGSEDYPLEPDAAIASDVEEAEIESITALPDLLDTPRLTGHQ